MRLSDSCFLFLVLLLLIYIFDSDLGRAFGPSAVKVLVVRYHRVERLEPMKKNTRINLEKEIAGGPESKNFNLSGRKLLMQREVSQEEASRNGNNYTKKKISHGRRTRKRRSIKHVHKKKSTHQKDEGGGVGAFTEDYRVPRPHPPRNN